MNLTFLKFMGALLTSFAANKEVRFMEQLPAVLGAAKDFDNKQRSADYKVRRCSEPSSPFMRRMLLGVMVNTI
jgi:hypothetical protein